MSVQIVVVQQDTIVFNCRQHIVHINSLTNYGRDSTLRYDPIHPSETGVHT
jgi:hypothetical protein